MQPQDESQEPTQAVASPITTAKGRQSFSTVKRYLSDEELGSPAVQKMLIDEIERLERDNTALEGYRERFHKADRELGVLKEQGRKSIAVEVAYGVGLTVGSALMVHGLSIWETVVSNASILVVLGFFLAIGGIAARVIER